MKHQKSRKILSALLSALLVLTLLPVTAFSAVAQSGEKVTFGDYTYKVTDENAKTCEIIKYSGTEETVAVPSVLNGYRVLAITGTGKTGGAFKNNRKMIAAAIPSGVTAIGAYAFSGCTALEAVTIPKGIESISDYAFMGCAKLTSVTIPDSVTSIGTCAFYGCGFTSVTIPPHVKTIKSAAFRSCTGLQAVALPEGVTSLENDVFNGCTQLTSVTIPHSVKRIGMTAFVNCSSLTALTIPDGVESIGYLAFAGCTQLTCVMLPNSLKSIDTSAFQACSALTSVIIPGSVTSIAGDAFSACPKLTIYGYAGSAAETYTNSAYMPFQALTDIQNTEHNAAVAVSTADLRPNSTVQTVVNKIDDRQTEYALALEADGISYQPNSMTLVTLPVPENLTAEEVNVYRQNDNGTYTDMHAALQSGRLSFLSKGLGSYILTTDFLDEKLGDMNGDGNVRLADYSIMVERISSMDTDALSRRTKYTADLNHDTAIDAFDAALLDRMLKA